MSTAQAGTAGGVSGRQLLADHHVLVASDSAFQRRARLLQALWREAQDCKFGTHNG
jgi:hypothetical protein